MVNKIRGMGQNEGEIFPFIPLPSSLLYSQTREMPTH